MADHNLNLFRRKQQELEELEEKIKNEKTDPQSQK